MMEQRSHQLELDLKHKEGQLKTMTHMHDVKDAHFIKAAEDLIKAEEELKMEKIAYEELKQDLSELKIKADVEIRGLQIALKEDRVLLQENQEILVQNEAEVSKLNKVIEDLKKKNNDLRIVSKAAKDSEEATKLQLAKLVELREKDRVDFEVS